MTALDKRQAKAKAERERARKRKLARETDAQVVAEPPERAEETS